MGDFVLDIKDFVDDMNEGLIAIDRHARIVAYNRKAKDMIGASRNCIRGHQSGKLEKGDIVILAFTAFGQDAGGITEEDLRLFGIDLLHIEKGTTLLAVGQYGTGVPGKSKLNGPSNIIEQFIMSDEFMDAQFTSKIDFVDHYVEINIEKEKFRYYYNNYFNHFVILDRNKHVKFYQMGGYTLWNEDLKDLINGASFSAKQVGYNEKTLLDRPLVEFHKEEEIIKDLMDCAKGDHIGYFRKSGSINGINVISTLKPILREKEVVGGVLIISDITRLQITENQRNRAYRKLKEVNAVLEDAKKYDDTFSCIIGSSHRIQEIKKMAYMASRFKSTVLILGESGTGKSVLARGIHKASELRDGPFVEVNLNSIPESLIESELFGYEKGAFTGANQKGKKGYFELADRGTLFLDEIGDLPKALQVKLLHVIQNRSFYRVGGSEEVQVDVRIIAATNRNLEKDVKENRFREDLYYRINVFPIKQPPLRERIEDLHEIVAYILPRLTKKIGVEDKVVSPETYEKMSQYSWPGNIRELENVLERAVAISEGQTILPSHLHIKVAHKHWMNDTAILKPLKSTLQEVELDVIERLMHYTNEDKDKVMEILNIKKTKLYESLKLIKGKDSEISEL
ncbi:MAG: sigma 54-interacting transcriptional regulator [Clostridia bacterium]|nr:sigma 54-interacting transcriptional regulator [Clostridia bacterium]